MQLEIKKPSSIYVFNNIDAISTFFNEKDEYDNISKKWSEGFLLFKLGKGDFNLLHATKRIKSEYSAMSLKRPVVHVMMQMPFDTIEKIDDTIRAMLVDMFPDDIEYINFSDKSNETGEYILVNIKPILKELGKLHLLNIHLNNNQIKNHLHSDKFVKLTESLLLDMIQKVLDFNFNCPTLLFTPYKKQTVIINRISAYYDNSIRYINVWAATRAAKTAAIIKLSIDKGLLPIFIGKSKTSMASAINDHSRWFSDKTEMIVFSVNGAGKNFSPKKLLMELKLKNINPCKVVFIIDEADDKSHSNQSITAYKSSRKLIEQHGYSVDLVIAMSATRPYQADKILNVLKRPEEDTAIVELPYEECRTIDPENTPKRTMVVQAFDLTKDNYTFQSLLDENNVGGAVILSNLIVKYGFGDVKIQNSKKIIKHNSKTPDYFIRLVSNTTDKVTNFINVLEVDLLNLKDDYLVVEITGNNSIKYKVGQKIFTMNNGNAEKIVKQIKIDNPNKILVLVTMGMATTSFSFKSIGRSIILSPDGVTADMYQGAHRSTTPDIDNKEDAQMFVFTTAEFRFKDMLSLETIKMPRDEKEKYYNLFLNNGGTCIYNLINNGQSFPMSLDNKFNFVDILDEQSKFLATTINFETILEEGDYNIGKGVNTTTTTLDESIKPTKVDARGKPVNPNKKTKKQTKKQKSPFKDMATATMFLPIIATYFIKDCNTIEDMINHDRIWKQISLDKESFFNLFDTNKIWKESFETRWSIVKNWSKEEYFDAIMNVMKTEVFKKLKIKTPPNINLPFELLLGNKSISENFQSGFLKKGQSMLLYFSQIYYQDLAPLVNELVAGGINVSIVVPESKTHVFETYIIPSNNYCKINIITEEYISNYNYKKGNKLIMKQDYIVSNPPYQGTNSSAPLWQLITHKCHTYLLKQTGLLSIVHPGNWKTATNYLVKNKKETTDVRNMILNHKTKHITLHDTKSGTKTFGASTIYDCYVISKEKSDDNSKLEVLTQEGKIEIIDVSITNSIPVGRVKEFENISTPDINNRLKINISNIKSGDRVTVKDATHKVPVVTKLNQDTETQTFEDFLEYTTHLPEEQQTQKLIISRGGTYSFVDDKGIYGVAVDGFFIIDSTENLYKMNKVFDESEEFRLLLSEISGSNDKRTLDPKRCSRSYIFEFTKTFWKGFYTDKMHKELIEVGKINE